MYNLIEFCDNYVDASGSLWKFKIDEVPANNADDVTVYNSQSFKYKAALVEKTTGAFANAKRFVKKQKIVVPLKYLSNFWRSLEMPLINCKVHLELNWIEDSNLSTAGDSAKFKITDAKLHVPIVTLSTKDNINMTKNLNNGLKRSVFWYSYQTIPAKVINKRDNIYELFSARLKGARTLFVLAYVVDAGAANNEAGIKNKKNYFLPRGEIKDYNVLIDARNFYD